MRRFVTALLLVLWSVSIADAAGANARVWCIGADGHSGVEVLVLTGCADARAGGPQTGGAVGEDHCGSCMDVVLASDQNMQRLVTMVPPPQEKLVPILFLPILLPAQGDMPTNWTPAPTDPPGISPRLIAHRSVVILI
jgi:hypothetical protein